MIKSILQIVTDVSSAGLIGFHWTDTATGIHIDGKMSGGESNARAIILRIYGEWTPQVYVHNTELKTRAFEKWVKGYTYYDIDGAAEAIKTALAAVPQTETPQSKLHPRAVLAVIRHPDAQGDFWLVEQSPGGLIPLVRYGQKNPRALLEALPEAITALDEADTAFVCMNICDGLTPQARGVIKKAWGLVQTAMAKARPSGAYADAVKDPKTAASIIKRERGIFTRLYRACQGLLDAYAPDADRTAAREGETALHSAVVEARAAIRETPSAMKD